MAATSDIRGWENVDAWGDPTLQFGLRFGLDMEVELGPDPSDLGKAAFARLAF